MFFEKLNPIVLENIDDISKITVLSEGIVCFCTQGYAEKEIYKLNFLRNDKIERSIRLPNLYGYDRDCERGYAPHLFKRRLLINFIQDSNNSSSLAHPYTCLFVQYSLKGELLCGTILDATVDDIAVTSNGGQFVLSHTGYGVKEKPQFTFLSPEGEWLWTLKGKDLGNPKDAFWLLPRDRALLVTTFNHSAYWGQVDKLRIYGADGNLQAEWKPPLRMIGGCKKNDLIIPTMTGLIISGFDSRPRSDDLPTICLVDEAGQVLERFGIHWGSFASVTVDNDRMALYLNTFLMGEASLVRFSLEKGIPDFYSVPVRKARNTPPPVICKCGDVIFAEGSVFLFCLSDTWEQKWTLKLNANIVDMKLVDDILYVMTLDETTHIAILYEYALL